MNPNKLVLTDINELKSFLSETIREQLTALQPTQPEPEESELLTIPDICRMFGKSKQTVHQWKRKGLLPFYRVSNKIYFRKNEVLAAMKKAVRREVL